LSLPPVFLPEVIAVHVEPNEHSELLQDEWEQYVEKPFRRPASSRPGSRSCPHPTALSSSPSFSSSSIFRKNPDRSIVVVIPELVEDRWYEYFLHNQRGRLLEWVLLARGNERIFTVSAPWYVGKRT
jgi:hypothetical protein